jgi:AcrR family transcriptional regulator
LHAKKNMIEHKDTWIKTGYKIAALEGFNALKIEKLAKKVGISKSSFYHYFADIELFTQHLLEFHLQQSHVMAHKEQQAQNISPELIDILVEHKIDLLFNRQLRFFRNNASFAEILQQSNEIIGNSFAYVWIRELNLQLSPIQLQAIFELALENFYLQINADNLNREWLTAYFLNLKRLVGVLSGKWQ